MPQLQCEEIRFPSADGVHTVAASMYTMPGVPVRAVLQLSHGMCEYVQRYRPMAQWYCPARHSSGRQRPTWVTAVPQTKGSTAIMASPAAVTTC